MRFDLLDEYSTLVPFGLGVSRNVALQDHPTLPAQAARRGTIANFAGHRELLRKLFGALRDRGARLFAA